MVFLVVWTVGIVAMEAWNFRAVYLGRGRRAHALQRATDEQNPRGVGLTALGAVSSKPPSGRVGACVPEWPTMEHRIE